MFFEKIIRIAKTENLIKKVFAIDPPVVALLNSENGRAETEVKIGTHISLTCSVSDGNPSVSELFPYQLYFTWCIAPLKLQYFPNCNSDCCPLPPNVKRTMLWGTEIIDISTAQLNHLGKYWCFVYVKKINASSQSNIHNMKLERKIN